HTNFKLEKGGEYLALVDPKTNIVSAFGSFSTNVPPIVTNYPPQQSDVSYGRAAGDPNLAGYFTISTPGAQNSTRGTGFAAEPIFSLASGVYTNNSLSLTITVPAGTTVRYTTDGTVPTATSTAYTVP